MDSLDLSEKIIKVVGDRLWEHFGIIIPCQCPNNGSGDCKYCEALENIRAEIEEMIDSAVEDEKWNEMRDSRNRYS